jgi:hypothetical protein
MNLERSSQRSSTFRKLRTGGRRTILVSSIIIIYGFCGKDKDRDRDRDKETWNSETLVDQIGLDASEIEYYKWVLCVLCVRLDFSARKAKAFESAQLKPPSLFLFLPVGGRI